MAILTRVPRLCATQQRLRRSPRLIAHRGNVCGVQAERENTLGYLKEALAAGFEVEVDVRIDSGQLWLGHDAPTQAVELGFLMDARVWTHCKTVATYLELGKHKDVNAFFQDHDEIAPTTRGFLWHHSRSRTFGDRSIATWLTLDASRGLEQVELAGICTDEPVRYRATRTSAVPERPGLPFDLLVLDIDGVLTDGTKTYGRDGQVLSKAFCDQDFTAIKRFRAAGVKVCLLSGDRTVNEEIAKTRQLDFYSARDASGNIDKKRFLPTLAARYAVPEDRIAYVGDDYYDLTILEAARWSYCPSNAIACVQDVVTEVLDRDGGHGVVAALYDLWRAAIPHAFPTDSWEVNTR